MLYLDPSAWLKRYFVEAGTERVAAIFAGEEILACAHFGLLEMVAAISRRLHHEGYPEQQIRDRTEAVRRDFALFHGVGWDDELAAASEAVALRRHLRAADSVHLAAALLLAQRHPVILVSADHELLQGAYDEGLQGLNPVAP